MKKYFTKTLLFLLIFLDKTEAQTSESWILSFETAPNVRFVSGIFNVNEASNATIGFYTGLTAQFAINDRFSFVSGVGFERKGGVTKIFWTDFNATPLGPYPSYFNYDYLVFPAMLRADFGRKKQYFVNGGLYFGYLLAAKINVESPNSTIKVNDGNIDKYDYGVSIGGGTRVQIAKNLSMPIEIRSNHGFVNVNNVPLANNGKIRTNAINLIVGLSYNFGNN
jgi:opacity protein-like surface antigen